MSATPAPPGLAARLREGAERALAGARALEALPLLDRLGRLDGHAAEAMRLRGEALLRLDRLKEAELAADDAVVADGSADALTLRARVRLAQGRAADATDDAAAAVMAKPSDPDARALLGCALLELRRYDEAIWFLGGAFDADPDRADRALQLAQAFLLAKRFAPAEELLDHLSRTAPDVPGLAAMRAQAELLAGRPDTASVLARGAIAGGDVSAAMHSILAHALVDLGRMADAAPHFATASRLSPNNGYLAHLAAASGGIADHADPTDYVTRLFDGYAGHFEGALLGLGYRVPGLIRRAAERLPAILAGGRLGPVLDLGCGTGLVGVVLDDLLPDPSARRLVGIDLSDAMLAQARAKGLYTELRRGDLVTLLAADPQRYALVTAADVLCYLGDLAPAFAAIRPCLAPDGVLLFSVERGVAEPGWQLNGQGRFAHAPGYVQEALRAAGFAVLEAREEDLRLDGDAAVPGLLVTARPHAH